MIDNRKMLQYILMAVVVGMGIPVFALLGADEGERLASVGYPQGVGKAAGAPRDYRMAVLASASGVSQGKDLFQRNCVACHGTGFDGNGAAAAGLTPAPRNFLDPDARWTRSRDPEDIYRSISEGSPGTAMMAFGRQLSVEERWALVHFLGTLPGLEGKFKPVDDGFASAWKPGTDR